MNLEPIGPETAVELYLAEREAEATESTIRSHRARLNQFVRWCGEREIENLNDLTGRKLHEYRLWRRNDGDLKKTTLKTQMDTLRVFVRFLGTIDGVHPDLHQKVRSPDLKPGDDVRDVMLDHEQAEPVLDYLERYEYASLPHVTLALLWHTMMRLGAARALDVGDYSPEEQYLTVEHRPETGTPVKKGSQGERHVALSGELCMLLDDWLRDQRPDVTDKHGRKPLLATPYGRSSKSTVRRYCYQYTRPCAVGQECPHDRDPEACEATNTDELSKCPSNVNPHAIRRGSITHHLNSDVPETTVGDRANVSQRVLEMHYDRRTEKEKMEQRREYLGNI
jgi:integrase